VRKPDFFHIPSLQIDPKTAEDEQRLAEYFEASHLRGDVAAIGEIFTVDEELGP
jgi:hypothetical protein